MAGRPKRRARLAAGLPATPVHTPASGIPAGGPAGGPGQGPPSGIGSGGPASGIPASNTPVRMAPDAPPASHGARTPRVYGPLAEALAAGLTDERPDLDRYPEAVAAWATAEAQAALIRAHLADVGPIDTGAATPTPRTGVLDLLARTERAAARHRASLGLDPRSEASLARERAAAATLSVDLDALAASGRAVLARRATDTSLPAAVRALPAASTEHGTEHQPWEAT